MLNDEESIKYREFILGLIELAEERRRQLEQTIRRIDEQLRSGLGNAEQLTTERRAIEVDYGKIVEHLSTLGATK